MDGAVAVVAIVGYVGGSVLPDTPQGNDLGGLAGFRRSLYGCLAARADALFELVDALCCPVAVRSVAHLSLSVAHRRGHGSGYAALARGRVDTAALRDLLARHRPAGWVPDVAVDATT